MEFFKTIDDKGNIVYVNLNTISFIKTTFDDKIHFVYFNNGLNIILGSKAFYELLTQIENSNKD